MKLFRSFPAACGRAATLAFAIAIGGAAWGQPTRLPLPPVGDTAPATGDRDASSAIDSVIGGDLSLQQREIRLGALLDSSVADRSLGHTEYRRASAELTAIKATEERLRRRNHGELTDTETFRLEGRIKSLAQSIRWKP